MARTKTSRKRIIDDVMKGAVTYDNSTKEWRMEQIKWQPDGSHYARFGAIYLPREFKSETPPFLLEFYHAYVNYMVSVVTLPRGSSKTTSEKTIIRYDSVTYGRDDLVPQEFQSPVSMFFAKNDKAAFRVIGSCKRSLERNYLIKQDFGELFGGGVEQALEYHLSNGKVVIGGGWEGTSRGMLLDDGNRVTNWIVDDLLDRKSARSETTRREIFEWITSEVMGLEGGVGEEARGLITGNRLHYHDHLGMLKEKANEVDEDGEHLINYMEYSMVTERDAEGRITGSLWPERFPPKLLRKKEKKMSRGFRREYENKPTADDELTFSADALQRFKFARSAVDESWPGVLAIDQATGPGKSHDYTVILLGRQSPDKVVWIYKGFRGRVKMKRGAQIAIEFLKSEPNIRRMDVESIAAQIAMVDMLKEMCRDEGIRIKINAIDNKSRTKDNIPVNKEERISTLEPDVESGDCRICEDLVWLISEMEEHPNSEHDDGPDTVEMVYSRFVRRKITTDGKSANTGARMATIDPMKSGGQSLRKSGSSSDRAMQFAGTNTRGMIERFK